MTFTRTSAGQIAAFLFAPHPIVWVEGPEDVEAFTCLADDLGFELKIAGDSSQCRAIEAALKDKDLPFSVIRDADYDVLGKERRYHRRSIVLRRYAMENYLAERSAFDRICRALCRAEAGTDPVGRIFDDLERELEKLRELVILDVAQQNSPVGVAVLPSAIDALFTSAYSFEIDSGRVGAIASRTRPRIDPEAVKSAERLLAQFLATHRFLDVLRGHLVFGGLRRALQVAVRRAGLRLTADDRIIRLSLANEVWTRQPTNDHRATIRKLRRAVAEIKTIKARALGAKGTPRRLR